MTTKESVSLSPIKAIILDVGGVLYDSYAGEGKLNQPLVDILNANKDHLKFGVISSTSVDLKSILDKEGFEGFFSVILTTGDTGLDKVEPYIYEKAANMMGLKTSEIIFIDNEKQYIAAAASTGMKTILYKDFADCQAKLAAML